MRMRVGNRIRFCTTLLAGVAALTFAGGVAKEASWKLGATAKASWERRRKHRRKRQRIHHLFPLPVSWPSPSLLSKWVCQSRPLVRRFRRTIRRHLRKSHSARSFFSTVAYRLMEPLLVVPATTRRALSPTEDPPRSASKAASASATRRLF